MFKKILIPLDGSPMADRAVPYAARLAKASGAHLALLTVTAPLGWTYEYRKGSDPGTERDALVDLQEASARLKAEGLNVDIETTSGYHTDAGKVIADLGQRREADLIVMSTHGRGGVGRWLYGSVADRVLREARSPVLLVPMSAEKAWADDRPLKILVPLDGSGFSEAALDSARMVMESTGAEVLLLRVVQPPSPMFAAEAYVYVDWDQQAEISDAERYLEEVADRVRGARGQVRLSTVVGSPASLIADIAREQNIDLIVMATHGRGGLARLVMGSVATSVLHQARVPLLVRRSEGLVEAAEDNGGTAVHQQRGSAEAAVQG